MDDPSFWDVILWVFWFMLLVAWLSLVFRIIGDLFRDRELGGGAKALWMLFILFLPWVGVLAYLLARGGGMAERDVRAGQEQEQAFRTYVQQAAGTGGGGGGGVADELKKLAELRDSGTITPADYESAKAKVLA
jgi:Short C-terminal domain/Phospholipase_D-nuclease N-terminal